MYVKLFSRKSIEKSADPEVLDNKLTTIKQRLLVTFGAVLMFLLADFIQPDFMEADLAPLIWLFLMLAPVITGIYLLVSPTWRAQPLIERRNTTLGGIAIGLLAFSTLPLWLMQHGDAEAIPYIILLVVGGLLLNWAHKKIGQPIEDKTQTDDIDLFP